LQVKGNQQKLQKVCRKIVTENTPDEQYISHDKKRKSRIEKRVVSIFATKEHTLGDVWDDHINTLISVERTVKLYDTKKKETTRSIEQALYISTATLTAKEFSQAIRSHWKIENTNHYVRDVSLGEDFSRIRKNPESVAVLRSFALNLLRDNEERNISQALYRNGCSVQRVLGYRGIKTDGS